MKSGKKVWLVCGASGDYEERQDWRVRAFPCQESAQRYMDLCVGASEAARERYRGLREKMLESQCGGDGLAVFLFWESNRKEMLAWRKMDPHGIFDDDTAYYTEGVDFDDE